MAAAYAFQHVLTSSRIVEIDSSGYGRSQEPGVRSQNGGGVRVSACGDFFHPYRGDRLMSEERLLLIG